MNVYKLIIRYNKTAVQKEYTCIYLEGLEEGKQKDYTDIHIPV